MWVDKAFKRGFNLSVLQWPDTVDLKPLLPLLFCVFTSASRDFVCC